MARSAPGPALMEARFSMINSSGRRHGRRSLRRLAWVSALTLVGVLGLSGVAGAQPSTPSAPGSPTAPGSYIVRLAGAPVAAYAGGVRGLAATRATPGHRLDVRSDAAERYRSHLRQQQAAVAARIGVTPRQAYTVALNGFAATMTAQQVASLRRTPGVSAVTPDRRSRSTDDSVNVDLLKLSGARGVWSGLGGTSRAGRGVVVAVLDSGIWPESASFAAPRLTAAKPTKTEPFRPYRSGTKIIMKKSDGGTFTGRCEAGERFRSSACNAKIISARYFLDGLLDGELLDEFADYVSPRDHHGHGTHVASTAAGRAGVPATVKGTRLGTISGVAPAAALAVYKVFWNQGQGGPPEGADSDIVAAIDQAVADGVDVINFSGGHESLTTVDDPVEEAFRRAAAAGIFVATSAGNLGPDDSSVDHPSPWLTTVAASTMRARSTKPVPYPQVAGFSARGPVAIDDADLIKPDLAAPGVDVLAAYAPVGGATPFAYSSGTSMAAPQVAGLGALLLGVRPGLSPMAVKSVLMTTATPLRTTTGQPAPTRTPAARATSRRTGCSTSGSWSTPASGTGWAT